MNNYNFNNYFNDVKGLKGYSVDKLSNNDLKKFRKIVNDQYFEVLKQYKPNENDLNHKIYSYNKTLISKSDSHKKCWSKINRIFTRTNYLKVQKTDFFTALKKQLNWFEITDEENVGYPELYFRICRPYPYKDVGPLHADAWFWDLGHGEMPKTKFNTKRIKFWFSLYNSNNNTGFRYVEGSHKKNYKYQSEYRDRFLKPVFNEDFFDLNISKLKSPPGTFIIFNDKLLHGGYITKGDTRVSFEFCLIIKK